MDETNERIVALNSASPAIGNPRERRVTEENDCGEFSPQEKRKRGLDNA